MGNGWYPEDLELYLLQIICHFGFLDLEMGLG